MKRSKNTTQVVFANKTFT